MSETAYDRHAEFYVAFVDHVTESRPHIVSTQELLSEAGPLDGLDVCDLACGEGHFSRLLAEHGARVQAYDSSSKLIAVASRRSDSAISYGVEDVQTLASVKSGAFDIVFCHMAAMDIPDIDALFATVKRILRPRGRFFLTLLHPCFETPFDGSTGNIAETDRDGNFVACRVMRYRNEGHWQSGGKGVRGRMGAYHRMLSTYVNALIERGHRITKLLEPMIPIDAYDDIDDQWAMAIPRRLTICTSV